MVLIFASYDCLVRATTRSPMRVSAAERLVASGGQVKNGCPAVAEAEDHRMRVGTTDVKKVHTRLITHRQRTVISRLKPRQFAESNVSASTQRASRGRTRARAWVWESLRDGR